MTLPTLSVILPNFNHAHYLPGCLDSILEQSVQPIEIIIIDDASTDNSVTVIEEFARKHSHIRLVRNPENRGVIVRMNEGLQLARGEYVYYCAADDKVLPGLFEKSLQLLSEHKEAPVCFSDPASFDHETGRVSQNRLNLSNTPTFFTPQQLVEQSRHHRLLISGMSTLKVSTIKEMGGFRPELKWHCDYFCLFAASFRHGACYIPEALNLWRATPNSYMTKGQKRWETQRRVVESVLNLLLSDSYKDIRPYFQDSGALSLMPGIIATILSKKEYRSFYNFTLLKRAVPAEIFWRLPHPLQRVLRRIRT